MPDNDKKSLDDAVAHMAPIISHEIRNPLAIIGNSSYFIKTKLSKDGTVDPKIARHITIIETELKHADDVLGEILAYTRMAEPRKTDVELKELGEAAAAELPKPESVTFKFSGDEIDVAGDAGLLSEALKHVLRNSIEAVGESGEITVAISKAKKIATIKVTDSGPGFADEVRDRLFTPFNTNRPRGVGVGLAFVHRVFTRHGGSAAVKDNAVILELPL
jgi:signal transduction histidine kinase